MTQAEDVVSALGADCHFCGGSINLHEAAIEPHSGDLMHRYCDQTSGDAVMAIMWVLHERLGQPDLLDTDTIALLAVTVRDMVRDSDAVDS